MPKTHRTCFRSIRLTRGELTSLRTKAHIAGLPVATFIRRAALGKRIRAQPGQIDLDAIHQLSRIGNNLNQIARAMNTARKGLRQPVGQERLEEALEKLHALFDKLGA